MYNSIPANDQKPSNEFGFILLVILIIFFLLQIFSSCRSERNNNYPVVHKEKLMSAGSNPNRK